MKLRNTMLDWSICFGIMLGVSKIRILIVAATILGYSILYSIFLLLQSKSYFSGLREKESSYGAGKYIAILVGPGNI